MRFLIAASRTTDHRWKLPIAKQLVDIGGERLIERTIRQFAPFGEVIVVCGSQRLPLDLAIPQVQAENDPRLGDINGIINARRYWAKDDRTTVLLGDVWFSDAAVQQIVAARSDWCLYGRPGWSTVTGKKSDEQFALGFEPDEQAGVIAAAEAGGYLVRKRKIRWTRFPQWFHLMHGLVDPKAIDRAPNVALGHFEIIDDTTDDIDKPEDYERLLARLDRGATLAATS